MSWNDLAPEDAAAAMAKDPAIKVLDVRTQPEHQAHRIGAAQLIPVQELAQRIAELDPDSSYLVVCEHGVRSVAACGFLEQHGFESLTNLQGGMARWVQSGLPYEQG